MSLNKVRDEKYNAIKNNPTFSKLSYEIIKSISHAMKIGDYSKNSFVYREKLDKQQFMYIVKHGEFKLIKQTPIHTFKNFMEITILSIGETFGVEQYKEGVEQNHVYSVYQNNQLLINQSSNKLVLRYKIQNSFQAYCSSISGQLYILSYQNFRSILINHQKLTSLTIILKNETQQKKEKLYLLIEQSLLNTQTQQQIKQRIRSHSTQLTYTDKVNLIIKGQRSFINNRTDQIDEDQYMHQSILQNIRATRTNLTEQSGTIFKRRHTISDVNDRLAFIKHEDYRSKMKILHHLGYKPKLKAKNCITASNKFF